MTATGVRVALLWSALGSVPLLARLAAGGPTAAGVVSDLACGLVLVALLPWLPAVGRVVVWALWTAVIVGAGMLARAVGRVPAWYDLHYLASPGFLAQSIPADATGGLLLLAGGLLVVAAWGFGRPAPAPCARTTATAVVAAVALLSLHQRLSAGAADAADWQVMNPWHALVRDLGRGAAAPSAAERTVAGHVRAVLRQDLTGSPVTRLGLPHNVLLIVVEGLPGGYVREVREAVDAPDLGFEFEHLPVALHDAMWVPDFAVHTHQTIRGLYAMLCGDVGKLSQSTPKATELLAAPGRAAACLPAQLARLGYSTHFLQAARLGFMGKDRFMPLVGFQEVHGFEWFGDRAVHVPFGWGADDLTFFEGALDYVRALRATGTPWFLGLLTVGTHHPYAAPDALVRAARDRRTASLMYLDVSLSAFLDRLRDDAALDDTLVIVTSDESHGSTAARWASSWGFAAIRAPASLPARQPGPFALLDVPISILDYVGAPVPPVLAGRSLFRRYADGRARVSYTSDRLRWELPDGHLVECADPHTCRVCRGSLIGRGNDCERADERGPALWASARRLDETLRGGAPLASLRFASGERHVLPEQVMNEWGDSLVGAQYLDFPARSRAHVTMRWRAIDTPAAGTQLRLVLRQAEETLDGMAPELPVLHAGEEREIAFTIDNRETRSAFSFHLLGDGGGEVEILDFTVDVIDDLLDES